MLVDVDRFWLEAIAFECLFGVVAKTTVLAGIENYFTFVHDLLCPITTSLLRSLSLLMSELTVKEFIDVVHRSRLIEQDRLLGALSNCKSDGTLPESPGGIAEYLRGQGLITRWQQKNLLQGKSCGFFLGTYRLLDHLGTGGMSSVFLAQHGSIDRLVAIKVLPGSRADDPAFLRRFDREAIAMSRLSHPNVVRVFDIEEEDGTHFMVMEYVRGKNLKAIVKESGPLSLTLAAHYTAQAAAGLQHAHERGLVHRDVKPANLVVSDNDLLKVLDLGLARVEDDGLAFSPGQSAGMMGTADYMSPEQAIDARVVDHRADIYSLGCTLYFFLTGHAPFTEGSSAERIQMHQQQKPRDVRAEREDCPHAIADVCMTMLEKDPAKRFPSLNVVSSRLQRWLTSTGFVTSNATYATSDFVPVLAQLQPDDGLAPELERVDEPQNLIEQRRVRQQQRVRAPLWLWLVLAVSSFLCIVLLVLLALR